jgi:GDPmannose 4,6-dehydratase
MLIGDASKARNVLGWRQKITFKELVKELVAHEIAQIK